MKNQINEWLATSKLNEIVKKYEEEEKTKKTILWILAIIGAAIAVAGIAYAVYRFLTPDDDFDDDFDDDDFDDDLFEEEDDDDSIFVDDDETDADED